MPASFKDDQPDAIDSVTVGLSMGDWVALDKRALGSAVRIVGELRLALAKHHTHGAYQLRGVS